MIVASFSPESWEAIGAIGTACGSVIAALCAAWAWQERRAKEKAELEAQRAREELRQIQRRGNAPFFQPSDALFGNLWLMNSDSGLGVLPSFNSPILHRSRHEVMLNSGDLVFFVVENLGQSPRRLSVTLDGEPISFQQEPDVDGAQGLQYLVYRYDKAKHGKEQQLAVFFEISNGVQDTHRYITRHGCRVLQRTDPA